MGLLNKMPFLVKSNIFYGKESIFPPWKLCLKKMILRSLLLNIFLWDEDAEYPAASLPLQQPVKGGKKYTWVLCFSISLDCSCQSARIFFSRHHEETISCDSPKMMLFRIPFLQSNRPNSEFLPPSRARGKTFKPLSLFLQEWMTPSSQFWDVRWIFVQHSYCGRSAMPWEGALCLVGVNAAISVGLP